MTNNATNKAWLWMLVGVCLLSMVSEALARVYVPSLGRWTTRDRAGYVDGPSAYLYVRGGPVGRADPSGLRATAPGGGCAGSDCQPPSSTPSVPPNPPPRHDRPIIPIGDPRCEAACGSSVDRPYYKGWCIDGREVICHCRPSTFGSGLPETGVWTQCLERFENDNFDLGAIGKCDGIRNGSPSNPVGDAFLCQKAQAYTRMAACFIDGYAQCDSASDPEKRKSCLLAMCDWQALSLCRASAFRVACDTYRLHPNDPDHLMNVQVWLRHHLNDCNEMSRKRKRDGNCGGLLN